MGAIHPHFKAVIRASDALIAYQRKAAESNAVPFGEERFTDDEMRELIKRDPKQASVLAKQTSPREVLDLIRKKDG